MKEGKYNLFIGRWQPPHEGHKKLIDTKINAGEKVCIGIRKTPQDEDNPFTIDEVIAMWKKFYPNAVVFPEEGDIVLMPMIDVKNVCYGRNPAWGIEEIRLDEETENISATDIRRKMKCSKT